MDHGYQLKLKLFLQTLVLVWPSIYARIIHLRFSENDQTFLEKESNFKCWQ